MKVNVKGFLICPKCGGKTHTKVIPGSILVHFPLFCPKCKEETVIDYTFPYPTKK